MSQQPPSLPRRFRAMLPAGIEVEIKTGIDEQTQLPDDETTRANLVQLLDLQGEPDRTIKLLSYLQSVVAVAFPSADPQGLATIEHGPKDNGIDLSFAVKGKTGVGIVQIKGPATRWTKDVLRELSLIRNQGRPVAEVNYVVGRRGMKKPDFADLLSSVPFPVHLLTWDDIVDRITLSPSSQNGNSPYTIVLVRTIEACRQLLSDIATFPDLLRVIADQRFEELIATLLHDLGFEDIVLTPVRKDGGKDVIASHFNPASGYKEVYLFECKHWVAGNKVTLKLVTKLQNIVKKDQATGGVIVAWGGFGPTVLEQQVELQRKNIHLKGEEDIVGWIRAWERQYGSPLLTPVNPLEIVGISGLGGSKRQAATS